MNILTKTEGLLVHIASFLGEPPRGGTKNLQFAQLIRDFVFLQALQQMNLPLFSFFNSIEITPINKDLGLVVEFDRMNDIFQQIHGVAKRSLAPDQFIEICTQHESRRLSRYAEMDKTTQQNQDHAICVLATTLRNSIPNIPTDPGKIRTWFADPANQPVLNTITRLEISNKDLKCIPREIGKLMGLCELFMENTNLSVIPAEIGNLINLITLDLSDNNLSELPAEISNLIGLRELFVESNNISELPGNFCNLMNLITIELSNNNISKLPPQIGNLVQLCILALSNNNISNPPPQIGKLVNLHYLYLDDNNISFIPPQIANLVQLKELNLTNNKISPVAPEIDTFLRNHNFSIGPQKISQGETAVANVSGAALTDDLAEDGEKKRSKK